MTHRPPRNFHPRRQDLTFMDIHFIGIPKIDSFTVFYTPELGRRRDFFLPTSRQTPSSPHVTIVGTVVPPVDIKSWGQVRDRSWSYTQCVYVYPSVADWILVGIHIQLKN